MDIQKTEPSFKGKLFIQNKLSSNADSKVKKLKAALEEIIKPKDYDLYLQQDYRYGLVNFTASHKCSPKPYGVNSVNVVVSSKASKYVEAAKGAIDKYEKSLSDIEQQKWEKQHKQNKIQNVKDIISSILFFPLFMIDDLIHEINPKWSKSFENLLGI